MPLPLPLPLPLPSRHAACFALGLALSLASCTSIFSYDECRVPGQCLREDTAALCADELDNDEDGQVDCRDPGCHAFCDEANETLCADGLDNDGDQLIDCQDIGCATTSHCAEDTETKCSDGLDTNHDGLTDCTDPSCCATATCHSLETCGELVLETDFSAGMDESGWLEHRASTGYHTSLNRVEVTSGGLALSAESGCYTFGEEVGAISREPLDLTTGRFFVQARIYVPPTAYWPARIGLVPHAATGRFLMNSGAQVMIDPCGPATSTIDATVPQSPTLFLDLFPYGGRRVSIRQGQTSTRYPSSDIVYPVFAEKEVWDVRLDIDDEEIVLFERLDDTWDLIARFQNPLVGRIFHLAFVAVTDSEYDASFRVERASIHRAPQNRWRRAYEETYSVSPEPAIEATNPDRCRWNPGTSTLDATWESGAEESCLAPLAEPWTGGALRLRYDLLVEEVEYGTSFEPFLMDAGRSYERSSTLGAGIGHDDLGPLFEARLCSGINPARVDPSLMLGRWLEVRAFYDPISGVAEASMADKESGALLAASSRSGWPCSLDLRYFGLSTLGFHRWPGSQAWGRVDNVEVLVREPWAGEAQ